MAITLLPIIESYVHAATTKDFSGSTVTNLGVSATDATGSGNQEGPVCTWNASGTGITGSLRGAKGKGSGLVWQGFYYASETTLTLTNNYSKDAKLSFTYDVTIANGGSAVVNGTTHTSAVTGKTVDVTLASKASITIKLTATQRSQLYNHPKPNGASITITNIQLIEDQSVTVNFGAAANGSYTVTKADGTPVDTSKALSAQAIDTFTLTATPAEGYAFAGWYFTPEGGTEAFYSGSATYTGASFATGGTLTAKFEDASLGVWKVGDAKFSDLSVALAAAQSGSVKTVIPLQDLTIDKNCTVPAGVTLLIPFDASFTSYGASPKSYEVPSDGVSDAARPLPKPYRTVTIADGVTVTVYGNIELAANHWASHGGGSIGGRPKEYYGRVIMNGTSQIVLQSGANLYAWGYVIGSDNAMVTANAGATIYEKMQVTDYRGGSITTGLTGSGGLVKEGIFPFNQYYIQNVEVKEVIKSGATLVCNAAIYASDVNENSVDFMGSKGMFRLTSGAQATKYYDADTDRLIIDVEGTMSMNAITVMGYDTKDFTLPLNNNLTINLKRGANVNINQHAVLLPGAVINVEEGATLTVAADKKAHLLDEDNWDIYCMGYRIKALTYVAGRNGAPVVRDPNALGDATLNLNGTLVLNGAIYTSAGNAQIISSEKCGKIVFNSAAPSSATTIKQSTITQASNFITGAQQIGENKTITMNPAVLTNGDKHKGTDRATTATSGAAAGSTFYYYDECNMWVKSNEDHTIHSYNEGVVTTAPTCTTAGVKTFTCTVCGATKTEAVAAIGHKNKEHHEKVDATCVATGTIEYWSCPDCGKNFSDESCTTEVTDLTIEIDATNHVHKSEQVQQDATCLDKGYTAGTYCEDCDKWISGHEEIPAIGHKNKVQHEKVDATCVTTGTIEYWSCPDCGKNFSNEDCTTAVTELTIPVDPDNHDLVTTDAKDPTCTEIGWDEYVTCQREGCGHTTYVEKPATDHAWGVPGYTDNGDGTHTATYTCGNNGEHIKSDDPVGHSYIDGECVCGAEKPVQTGLKGDVNLDEEVDMDDVVALMQHVLRAELITDSTALANGEVTSDAVLDMDDVVKLMQYVLKAIDTLN